MSLILSEHGRIGLTKSDGDATNRVHVRTAYIEQWKRLIKKTGGKRNEMKQITIRLINTDEGEIQEVNPPKTIAPPYSLNCSIKNDIEYEK